MPVVKMPLLVDSNSPAYWRDGQFHLLNSSGTAHLSIGKDQLQLNQSLSQEVVVNRRDHFPMWIEAVWQDRDGTLYAWYHHEPSGLCPGSSLTAPEIGALVSYDGGKSFFDLGIILSSGDAMDCSAKNGFFGGGHGDFSVIVDREQRFFYFLFDNYGGPLAGQGVAIARLAFEHRSNPRGVVWKYFQGDWYQPGLGGQVTPAFPATIAWQRRNARSLWGPSAHWNTYLRSYVVLMNHACCRPMWPQEGIYVSFNADLSKPADWTRPERILRGRDIGSAPGFYPQVLGLDPGGTDTEAGQIARLYIKGVSNWEIVFFYGENDSGGQVNPLTNTVGLPVPRQPSN